jgi:hypothetical protein
MASYTAQSREPGRAPVEMGGRKDGWWTESLSFGLTFALFVIYTTYRMFENADFFYPGGLGDTAHAATYLSPFYSPLLPLNITLNIPLLGAKTISPAIYILIFPLAFRMTCYYYRKAYYRAYLRDPAACAVPEPMAASRMKYTGERVFPFIVQNFHRFALYAALIILAILAWDTVKSFMFQEPGDISGAQHFGIGVGSIIYVVNIVLLCGYTFGCHSFRHLIGGGTDCYSCSALSRTKYGMWQKVSFLNKRHAGFALWSMIWVGLTDLYVNLLCKGIIPFDLRLF